MKANRSSPAPQRRIQLRVLQPSPSPLLRLYCFPYAGGDGSIYRGWPNYLPAQIEVCVVDLPGRAPLFTAPAFTALPELLEHLAPAIRSHTNRPFAFFGYSMGALISFELAHALAATGGGKPSALFVAAHRAPHLASRRPNIHHLPDREFLDYLRKLAGTPPAALEHIELMDLLLPLLRSDFSLCESYVYEPKPVLSLPIHVFGGSDDEEVSREELQAWQQHTQARFTMSEFAGNHFFLQDSRDAVLAQLGDLLVELSSRVRQAQRWVTSETDQSGFPPGSALDDK
jgi:medium-chain acyl-[acyl-carrier-protein] hydrolase